MLNGNDFLPGASCHHVHITLCGSSRFRAASSRHMQHVPARNTRSTHPFHLMMRSSLVTLIAERGHLHIISEHPTSRHSFASSSRQRRMTVRIEVLACVDGVLPTPSASLPTVPGGDGIAVQENDIRPGNIAPGTGVGDR